MHVTLKWFLNCLFFAPFSFSPTFHQKKRKHFFDGKEQKISKVQTRRKHFFESLIFFLATFSFAFFSTRSLPKNLILNSNKSWKCVQKECRLNSDFISQKISYMLPKLEKRSLKYILKFESARESWNVAPSKVWKQRTLFSFWFYVRWKLRNKIWAKATFF